MSLSKIEIESIALQLHQLRKQCGTTEPFSKSKPFSQLDAYAIQKAGIDLRINDSEVITGFKMGLTSEAKMKQMGLATPIFGVLTESMQVQSTLDVKNAPGKPSPYSLIHPKIEPEIAFLVTKDIDRPLTFSEVPSYFGQVTTALEILDSRYVGFKYFSLDDVIADNASSSHFSINPNWRSTSEYVPATSPKDLKSVSLRFLEDSSQLALGLGSEILGHPFYSLVELTKLATMHGYKITKGMTVLSGAITASAPIKLGSNYSVDADSNLGTFNLKISN